MRTLSTGTRGWPQRRLPPPRHAAKSWPGTRISSPHSRRSWSYGSTTPGLGRALWPSRTRPSAPRAGCWRSTSPLPHAGYASARKSWLRQQASWLIVSRLSLPPRRLQPLLRGNWLVVATSRRQGRRLLPRSRETWPGTQKFPAFRRRRCFSGHLPRRGIYPVARTT